MNIWLKGVDLPFIWDELQHKTRLEEEKKFADDS